MYESYACRVDDHVPKMIDLEHQQPQPNVIESASMLYDFDSPGHNSEHHRAPNEPRVLSMMRSRERNRPIAFMNIIAA